ncbi:hypothetical protein [Arthrobacter sp. Br18]|uniref:hypothetical protein n=1 Tax=Arthrobacter sp. Br18 TaxID=1312954 RepID=UPI000479CBB6|nr:hypothetical protein [Arthrobacter sp. Br18]
MREINDTEWENQLCCDAVLEQVLECRNLKARQVLNLVLDQLVGMSEVCGSYEGLSDAGCR